MTMHTKKILLVAALAATAALAGCASTGKQESTGQYLDSSAITAKVKANLLADSDVKSMPIKVKTYKGTVQLSGFVDSDAQRQKAIEDARSVPGVREVKDSLVVK